MDLVGIVLQRHKGIPLAQYHGARTVHWTVPDEHVAVAQNTPSAHIQDLCSTVLFPGAKGKKKRQCFVKAWFDQSFNRMLWTTITSAFPATCVVSYDILRHLTTLPTLCLPLNSRIFPFPVLISSASSSPLTNLRPQNAVPRPSVKVVDFHCDRQSLTPQQVPVALRWCIYIYTFSSLFHHFLYLSWD